MTASSLTTALLLAGNEGCLSVVHSSLLVARATSNAVSLNPSIDQITFPLSETRRGDCFISHRQREGRRDNSFYTSSNELPIDSTFLVLGERTAHLFASLSLRRRCSAHSHTLRTSLPPPFEFQLPLSSHDPLPYCTLMLPESCSPRSLFGVVDVEVVLGSSVPVDEAEAAHELERLQRRSDERYLAGGCKEKERKSVLQDVSELPESTKCTKNMLAVFRANLEGDRVVAPPLFGVNIEADAQAELVLKRKSNFSHAPVRIQCP